MVVSTKIILNKQKVKLKLFAMNLNINILIVLEYHITSKVEVLNSHYSFNVTLV